MPIIQANANNIPAELTALPQWLIWRYEIRDGRRTKRPHTCQGYKADVTNPAHWSRFDYAVKMASRPGFADGIGIVFAATDPYCGIDLDRVWLSDANEGAEWAKGIIDRFSDTYQEGSPSDNGVKIWIRAKAQRCGRWTVESGAIEIYDHARYFAVTGRSNGVRVVRDHQQDIDRLIQRLDSLQGSAGRAPVIRGDGRIPQGQRHNTLVSFAGTMWKRGMDLAAIEAALFVVNERQCDPPHTPDHIRKIVESMAGWKR